ncbi:MAG TPA: bifunctional DNA-formamidopyrimidine glycosylase/DNA-(apurinic or apyrimidinic site) lyase [Candidatus Limnocylindrales bacterium]|nr:bifunctional DNA-formamidopyrimidine glycosylase/DNA-(apurinic or apyrimidinic site) lyase [Candidatus Limnocylindrales bacterium]
MPELPEVETVARDLRPLIVGAEIEGATASWPRTLRNLTPEAFDAAVRGRRIEAVGRRGKQLVVDLSGRAALTIHLKMTGQLFVVPRDRPADPYVRLVLRLADGRDVRFRDIRKFGRVGFYEGVDDPLAELGAEPLDDELSVREFRRLIRSRRGRLKPLLLDQTFLAGVGNIYADEALWRARLHPLRSASSLRRPDEARLYRALRDVLTEAVEHRGSSIDDYTAPEGDGEMQDRLDVYGRTGQACRRCGRPIRRVVVGGRATHFCSWCQRLSSADRRAASRILGAIEPRGGGALVAAGRRGRRWTELAAGEGATGLTPAELARQRSERTKRAAATRRAAARAGAGA